MKRFASILCIWLTLATPLWAADLRVEVDAALTEVPVNKTPLVDDTDFKSIEGAVAYNAGGMALRWHFVTTAGAYTVTSVTPTTGGDYDWTDQGDSGVYTIEIPATGGASINNDTEGVGWFTGVATGVYPWTGPTIEITKANIVNSLVNGSDKLEVDVVENGGNGWGGTDAPENLISFFDNSGNPTTKIVDNVATLGTGAITTNTFGAGAIDSAALATDAIGSGEFASTAANEIAEAAVVTKQGTLAGITNQTTITITGGAESDNAYRGCTIQLFDANAGEEGGAASDFRTIASYAFDNPTGTITLDSAPGFTMAGTVTYKIFPPGFTHAHKTTLEARASQASVDVIDDLLDLEIAAIKVVTDVLATMYRTDGGETEWDPESLEEAPTGSGASASTIAAAVWDRLLTDIDDAGSIGVFVKGLFEDATWGAFVDDAPTAEEAVQDGLTAQGYTTARAGYIDKAQYLPSATAGASGGVLIAGSNAATTFQAITSTGAFSINGVSTVAQTGDSFARIGAPAGLSLSADLAAVEGQTDDIGSAGAGLTGLPLNTLYTGSDLEDDIDNIEAGSGLTAQQTRDAMKLAPTAGAAEDGSLDDLISEGGGGGGISLSDLFHANPDDWDNLPDTFGQLWVNTKADATSAKTQATTAATQATTAATQSTAGATSSATAAGQATTAATEATAANTKAADIQGRLPTTLDSGLMRSNATVEMDSETVGELGDYLIENGFAGAPISASRWNTAHEWRFDSNLRITANNVVTETQEFDGLVVMDFTNVLPKGTRIFSIGTPTITPTAGVEPLLGSAVVEPTNMKVLLDTNVKTAGGPSTPAAAGTYTVTIPIVTTDGQAIARKGYLVIQ